MQAASYAIIPELVPPDAKIDQREIEEYNESELAVYRRGLIEGQERGDIEATLGIAETMLRNGFDIFTVSSNTSVPVDVIRRLFL